jgi:hypothetical protein
MATLGLVILWSGYMVGVFGYSKIKAATNGSPKLSVSDLALPSHRSVYLTAAAAWGNPTPANPNANTPSTSNNAPGSGITVPTEPGGIPVPGSTAGPGSGPTV